jgi:hypothetical protein
MTSFRTGWGWSRAGQTKPNTKNTKRTQFVGHSKENKTDLAFQTNPIRLPPRLWTPAPFLCRCHAAKPAILNGAGVKKVHD